MLPKTEKDWARPTASMALDIACICGDHADALKYFNQAVTAFKEARGSLPPQGRNANAICEEVLGCDLYELRMVRDGLNKKFSFDIL
jgi:hypothetical protein